MERGIPDIPIIPFQVRDNNGRTVTIGSLTVDQGSLVVLTMDRDIEVGSWDFSVKGDADGSGPMLASAGTGSEETSLTRPTYWKTKKPLD